MPQQPPSSDGYSTIRAHALLPEGVSSLQDRNPICAWVDCENWSEGEHQVHHYSGRIQLRLPLCEAHLERAVAERLKVTLVLHGEPVLVVEGVGERSD